MQLTINPKNSTQKRKAITILREADVKLSLLTVEGNNLIVKPKNATERNNLIKLEVALIKAGIDCGWVVQGDKFAALELTQFLDHLIDHLINNDLIDPNPAEDIRLLREAAARCDEYANELERWVQENDEDVGCGQTKQ